MVKIPAKTQQLADEYAKLRRLYRELESQLPLMSKQLVEVMDRSGLSRIATEYGSCRLVSSDRRNADVEVAEKVLNRPTFKEVTRTTVDLRKLDAMVRLGRITKLEYDKMVTVETRQEVRVY